MSAPAEPTTIAVGGDYDVVIGSGVLDRVGDLLAQVGVQVEAAAHPTTVRRKVRR